MGTFANYGHFVFKDKDWDFSRQTSFFLKKRKSCQTVKFFEIHDFKIFSTKDHFLFVSQKYKKNPNNRDLTSNQPQKNKNANC